MQRHALDEAIFEISSLEKKQLTNDRADSFPEERRDLQLCPKFSVSAHEVTLTHCQIQIWEHPTNELECAPGLRHSPHQPCQENEIPRPRTMSLPFVKLTQLAPCKQRGSLRRLSRCFSLVPPVRCIPGISTCFKFFFATGGFPEPMTKAKN